MKKRLVILSDYGLDDAAAGVYCLNNAKMFDGIDIVAIGGNTSTENSFNNAKKLLVAYAKENGKVENVRLIDTLIVTQPFTHLPSIHGNDAMGDLFTHNFPLPVPVIKYNDWTKDILTLSKSKEIILFSLGPCTITKQLMDMFGDKNIEVADNKICGTLKNIQLVLMAGMVNATPNFEGMEFNQALDSVSYNYCLTFNHVVATLDTCRENVFNLANKRTKGISMLDKIINRSEELAEARHADNCYIYDFIAAHYLTCSELFKTQRQKDKWGNTVNQLKVIKDCKLI